MYDKKTLDEMTTPTGYVREGKHITASSTVPKPVKAGTLCPDCKRPQFRYGRFLICNGPARHAYNEQGVKIEY